MATVVNPLKELGRQRKEIERMNYLIHLLSGLLTGAILTTIFYIVVAMSYQDQYRALETQTGTVKQENQEIREANDELSQELEKYRSKFGWIEYCGYEEIASDLKFMDCDDIPKDAIGTVIGIQTNIVK